MCETPERMAVARRVIADLRRAAPSLQQRQRTSKDNENYAKDYHNASRLHFIGTWKARFEALCETLPPPPPLPQVPAGERIVLHIDMDCFFPSVAAALHPELAGLPLAVSWGMATSGHAEIASASYQARAMGVKNGMWLPEALKLCPALLVAPYQFGDYEVAAEAMYRVVFAATPHVMGVSVDECYADVSGLGDPSALAASLRERIRAATGCNASIGIGPSRLVARLATARAKPDGQLRLTQTEARAMLAPLPVATLPGIGHSMQAKLAEAGIETCGELASAEAGRVTAAIGAKQAERLRAFAKARDERPWEARPGRKTVGAQSSWGVRFGEVHEAERFINELAGEVSARLAAAGELRGRSITLKLWRTLADAPANAGKGSMGHGPCDNISRTLTLEHFTADAGRIGKEGCKMLRELGVAPADIRGVGLAVSRLEGRAGSGSARPTPARVTPAPPQKNYADRLIPSWWRQPVEAVAGTNGAATPPAPAKQDAASGGGGAAAGGGSGGGVVGYGGAKRSAVESLPTPPRKAGRAHGLASGAAGSSSGGAAGSSATHALPGALFGPPPCSVVLEASATLDEARDALIELLRSEFLEVALPQSRKARGGGVGSLAELLADGAEALLRLGGGSAAAVAAARALVHEAGALGHHSLTADPLRHAILSGQGTLEAWLEACEAVEQGVGALAQRLRECPWRGAAHVGKGGPGAWGVRSGIGLG